MILILRIYYNLPVVGNKILSVLLHIHELMSNVVYGKIMRRTYVTAPLLILRLQTGHY